MNLVDKPYDASNKGDDLDSPLVLNQEPPVIRNRAVIDTTITGAMFLRFQYGFLFSNSAATANTIERTLSAVAPYAPRIRYWSATADDISTDRIVMVLLLLL